MNDFTYSIYNSIYEHQSGSPLGPSDADGSDASIITEISTTTTPASPSSSDDSQFENEQATTTASPSISDRRHYENDEETTAAAPIEGQTVITQADAAWKMMTAKVNFTNNSIASQHER